MHMARRDGWRHTSTSFRPFVSWSFAADSDGRSPATSDSKKNQYAGGAAASDQPRHPQQASRARLLQRWRMPPEQKKLVEKTINASYLRDSKPIGVYSCMDGAPLNRTCKGCRISKVKCIFSAESSARCTRCVRLELECVLEQRGNLSTGASRLKAPGMSALKLSKRKADTGLATSDGEQKVPRRSTNEASRSNKLILQLCGMCAWRRNDAKLMAWILEQADEHGLSLSDFSPASAVLKVLESYHTPPAFIRQLLGSRDMLAVAFVQTANGHSRWIANAGFDQHVLSCRALADAAESMSPCQVAAMFSPASETEVLERQVYLPLFSSLTPPDAGLSRIAGAGTSREEKTDGEDPPDMTADSPAQAERPSGPEEAIEEAVVLHSEIVDETRLWRLVLRHQPTTTTGSVCCKVVFRCAVVQGGAELWFVSGYMPQQKADGAWMSTLEEPREEQQQPLQQPTARACDSSPSPSMSMLCTNDQQKLEEEALFDALQASSTEEVLRLLSEASG